MSVTDIVVWATLAVVFGWCALMVFATFSGRDAVGRADEEVDEAAQPESDPGTYGV